MNGQSAPNSAAGEGRLKLGALCWNQYTDWPSLLEAGRRADRVGFEELWTWDYRVPRQTSGRGELDRLRPALPRRGCSAPECEHVERLLDHC
jgi:hypothetical protein